MGKHTRGVTFLLGGILLLSTLAVSTTAGATAVAKPTVSGFAASPASLGKNGGVVTLSATVTQASSCVFSSTTVVTGLPATVACSTGLVSTSVTLPANTGKRTAKYKFTLSVTGSKTVKAKPISVAVTTTSPPTVPGAPNIGAATAGNASATVTWSAPASNGGSAVTGYVVTPYVGSAAQSTITVGNVTSDIVTGLTNGDTYTFTVAATNVIGTGQPSGSSNSVTPAVPPAPTVPGAPTIGTATAGNGSASVTFTAPASNGGSSVTGYTLTAIDSTNSVHGGQSNSGSTSPITVTGLTNGDTYIFTVAATNVIGTGTPSAASNSVAPQPNTGPCSPGPSKNLSGCNFAGQSLAGANFAGSNLVGANFSSANLAGANLRNTVLTGLTAGVAHAQVRTHPGKHRHAVGTRPTYTSVDMAGAVLTNADFQDANPDAASLPVTALSTGPMMDRADLSGATLTGANLLAASLSGANLTGIICKNTVFTNGDTYNNGLSLAIFSGVDLTGADLSGDTFSFTSLPNTNLTDANLTGAVLTGDDMTSTNLRGTNLEGANLIDVDLGDNDLSGNNLRNARLNGTRANGTNFAGSNMSGVTMSYGSTLVGATLTDATLTGASLGLYTDMSGANFTNANMNGVVMYYATLNGAVLTGANLTGANLNYADLTHATVLGTDLTNATVHDAKLQFSNLSGSNLTNVNLGWTNLSYATLTGVTLTGTNFNSANLNGVSSGGIAGSPLGMLDGKDVTWMVIGGYLVGPGANLAGADLSGLDMTNADLAGSALDGADIFGITWSNTTCPDGTKSFDEGDSCANNLTVPGAPTHVSGVSGNAQITASWAPPNNASSAGVVGYVATVADVTLGVNVQFTCTGTDSNHTCTVTGLSNGDTYVVTVVAVNGNGVAGPESAATAPMAPAADPDTPTYVDAVAGSGQAIVRWNSSANGWQAQVFSYIATASDQSSPGTHGDGSTCIAANPQAHWGNVSCTLTGLTNGDSYTFTVVAINGNGVTSPASAPSTPVVPKA